MKSFDGTRINLRRIGSGPPLVVVPGTLAPSVRYEALARILSADHQVVLVERRGYGKSCVGVGPCRTDFQVQDLVAVLALLDETAIVFGHSFGGVVALAARPSAGHAMKSLVLYEPPVAMLGGELVDLLERCRSMVEAGRPEEAVRLSLALGGASPAQCEAATRQLAWKMRALAPGLISDLECVTSMTIGDLKVDTWLDSAPDPPVALIESGLSDRRYTESVHLLKALIPAARHRFLPHEDHFFRDVESLAALIREEGAQASL
ncbi:alpha/beta fold hydrolase [Streptomyces sp. NPDC002588]|uniref:alpha/beta fold hydrolase n=1 Tax=Streptomyces sp. NPDC002588 TaxID=3154419 RepID=UPI003321064C